MHSKTRCLRSASRSGIRSTIIHFHVKLCLRSPELHKQKTTLMSILVVRHARSRNSLYTLDSSNVQKKVSTICLYTRCTMKELTEAFPVQTANGEKKTAWTGTSFCARTECLSQWSSFCLRCGGESYGPGGLKDSDWDDASASTQSSEAWLTAALETAGSGVSNKIVLWNWDQSGESNTCRSEVVRNPEINRYV